MQDQIVASENLSELDVDMFTDNEQLNRLTADELNRINQLKHLRTGQ